VKCGSCGEFPTEERHIQLLFIEEASTIWMDRED
jgi:hypothetical protein